MMHTCDLKVEFKLADKNSKILRRLMKNEFYTSQCASDFYNPNQKLHGLIQFYDAVKNQLSGLQNFQL